MLALAWLKLFIAYCESADDRVDAESVRKAIEREWRHGSSDVLTEGRRLNRERQ